MADPRRVGMAQRRRIGASASMYSNTMKPPSHSPGDTVKAPGRYGVQTVTGVVPNVTSPGNGSDGHAYIVSGGKAGRQSVHLSGELVPFQMGMEELQ